MDKALDMKPKAFRFPETLLEGAQAKADSLGTDLSEYVRNLVAEDLKLVYMDKNHSHRLIRTSKFRVPGTLLEKLLKRAEKKKMKLEAYIQHVLEQAC